MSGGGVFSVSLGRLESGEVVSVDFGFASHLALQGQTRSGKSVTAMGLLGRLSRVASEAGGRRVLVVGVDPTGLLLDPWAEYPHPEWRASGRGGDFAGVVEALVAEMDRRIGLLGFDEASGCWRDKLEAEDFVEDMPLLVVVVEEMASLLDQLKAGDAAAGRKGKAAHLGRFQLGVSRLLAESAKVGFRLLLMTQRFDASLLGGAARSNLATRITHGVDTGDAVRMLHPSASGELVERVGGFVAGFGLIERPGEGVCVFRSAPVGYREYAQVVASRAGGRG